MKIRKQNKRRLAWVGQYAHQEIKWQLVIDRCMAKLEAFTPKETEEQARRTEELLNSIFEAVTPPKPRFT